MRTRPPAAPLLALDRFSATAHPRLLRHTLVSPACTGSAPTVQFVTLPICSVTGAGRGLTRTARRSSPRMTDMLAERRCSIGPRSWARITCHPTRPRRQHGPIRNGREALDSDVRHRAGVDLPGAG